MTTLRPEAEERRAKPRTRRAPDYRLRGLDLDSPALTDAAPTRARKQYPGRWRRRRRHLIQWAIVVTVAVAAAVLLRASVLEPFSVRSASMAPTLRSGTGVLVVKPSLLTGSIKTGDIVVAHEPAGFSCRAGGDSSHRVVKRVIGLPGQTIWSARGRVYVDGRPFTEPGWYNSQFGELGGLKIARTTIPAGSYFVMGDNRTDACDSRAFGPIPKSSVVGKVVATISRNGHPFVHFM